MKSDKIDGRKYNGRKQIDPNSAQQKFLSAIKAADPKEVAEMHLGEPLAFSKS